MCWRRERMDMAGGLVSGLPGRSLMPVYYYLAPQPPAWVLYVAMRLVKVLCSLG